jgi:broad specificity phosphatase PhoE
VSACFRLLLRWALACALAAAAAARAQVPSVDLDEAARRLAAGGYVMMMRHAQTEAGIGDPPGFRLDDCSTQRNLSAEGREQARRAGAAIAAAGIRVSVVRSSAWCRCRETAELAFGRHEPWSALNSFFADRSDEPERTRSVVEFARTLRAPSNAMLVTHQVNITAAFGSWASPGEVVAGRWRDGRLAAEFRFLPQAR